MKEAVIRYVFDKKKVADKSKIKGLLQVEVRLKNSNKCKYISTGIHLYKHQFSDTNGFTCRNHDNAPAITGQARSVFTAIEAFVLSDKCQTLSDVVNWDKEDSSEYSVVDFIKSELKRKNVSFAVLQYNHSFLKRLEEYGKIKTFDDLTYENILGLDKTLMETIVSEPTLYKRHSLFKGYIQEAINRGYFKGTNPYVFFNNKKGKSKDPVYLDEREIELLKNYTPNYGYLERAKDLFLFQIRTGLAYIDLMHFGRESVSELDGYKIIKSPRQKTDETFITLFLPDAEKIAEKYNYELPQITNQKYNEYLKEVAKGAGITKNLTSHTGRHTFGTLLTISQGVPIETVSRMMGHTK